MRQTNLSFSRAGVVRGLHYHESGQDDLFACVRGMARVVVLDRESGETFTEDIGDENPVAIYIPGVNAHGFEARRTSCSATTSRPSTTRPTGRAHGRLERPARCTPMSSETPILSARDAAVES